MSYVRGASKVQPFRVLRSFEVQIIEARNHLIGLQKQIAESKAEASQVRHIALRARLRSAVEYRPMTPEQFQAEAQRSYDHAMRLHPDNAELGRFRLAEATAEAYETERAAA
ncbi:hypothetical protein ACFFON_15325 [Arthrobacter citreus]|uniref:hypothetical protein n=1 Tax=Arthrobacter TaxID=1663 RepID=UPI00126532D7|nr:hypothetical protein [Arthrobacter gandavensis]